MDPSNLTSAQREEIMRTAQAQVALQTMQTMLSSITEKCFKKCVTSPKGSLANSDQVSMYYPAGPFDFSLPSDDSQ